MCVYSVYSTVTMIGTKKAIESTTKLSTTVNVCVYVCVYWNAAYLSSISQSSPPHLFVYCLVSKPPNVTQSVLYMPNNP